MNTLSTFLPSLVLCAIAALNVLPAAAEDFTGKCVRVLDGDTIEVLHNGEPERIRLNGIDCPEKAQAFGMRAKQFTASLVAGQDVAVAAQNKDRYGRTIGEVTLADGRDVNSELVNAGYAWWYRRYSSDERLAKLEESARAARRGLWADTNPTPPWDFRHRVSNASPTVTNNGLTATKVEMTRPRLRTENWSLR